MTAPALASALSPPVRAAPSRPGTALIAAAVLALAAAWAGGHAANGLASGWRMHGRASAPPWAGGARSPARGDSPSAPVPAPYRVGTARYRGMVGASLYRAARAAGAGPGTAQRFLEAIAPGLDLDAPPAPTDTFDFTIRYGADGIATLIDARIADVAGRPVADMRSARIAERALANMAADRAASVSARAVPAFAPVAGRISSGYGMRLHPLLGTVRLHAGVDFAAPLGAPVHATGDGRVAFAGWHGGHGLFVRLDRGGGDGSGYAHLSRIAVWPGEAVRAGEVIGYVGSTGLSTGPHLHYEAYRAGHTVDPLAR